VVSEQKISVIDFIVGGGRNMGQLGDNNSSDIVTTYIPNPMQESSLALNWRMVSAGKDSSCAIKSDQSIWCWGNNEFGKIGVNNPSIKTLHKATKIVSSSNNNNWVSIVVGNTHVCGIREIAGTNAVIENTIYCWGKNEFGQVGNRTLIDSNIPESIGYTANNPWTNVVVGVEHSCAQKQDLSLWCWGSRDFNSFGDTLGDHTIPKQIGTKLDWISITTGSEYTIGSYVANPGTTTEFIVSDGWGLNKFGLIDSTKNQYIKIPVRMGLGFYFGSETVTCGNYNILFGISAPTYGIIDCRGDNTYKQTGTIDGKFGTPVVNATATNNPVDIGTDWKVVSTGLHHACAVHQTVDKFNSSAPLVLTNGTLYCWGDNSSGQLGIGGNKLGTYYAMPVAHPNATIGWETVSVGDDFSCGIDNSANNQLFCWGDNQFLQLAVDKINSVNETIPTLANFNGTPNSGWAALTSKGQNTCAMKKDGTAFCWGLLWVTQGSGPHSFFNVPVNGTSTHLPILDVSTGPNAQCSIRIDNTLWCAGSNKFGQLGRGTQGLSKGIEGFDSLGLAQESSKSTNWISVSVGLYHTCATKIDNSLWCWGSNKYGQLGDSTAWENLPVNILFNLN